MNTLEDNLSKINTQIPPQVTLVAVSKTQSIAIVQKAYDLGIRIFGENKVQEMSEKYEALPKDIEWHMIGHLQSNKVKYIVPYVSLIHGMDSKSLLKEISKQAQKIKRPINCLLQVHVAKEETKFGFLPQEILDFVSETDFEIDYPFVHIKGLMAMASNTDETSQIIKEFDLVKDLFDTLNKDKKSNAISMDILSMGMSGDFKVAIDCGSNMVRVGSSIFGHRNYTI